MNLILAIVAIIWVLGGFASYFTVFGKWTSNPKFEQIWFSCVWPVIIPLYGIHYVYNKFIVKKPVE